MKRILLVDSAFSARPIYEYLIASDHEVWVVGNRPSDVLAEAAGDHWIQQDYSDLEAMKDIVHRLDIHCVVPGCTDVSMRVCTALMGDSDFHDSPEINQRLENKFLFRQLCETLELPAPVRFEFSQFPRRGRYVCKPVDAYSGLGISVVDGSDLAMLEMGISHAKQYSQSDEFIIEEYIEGQLYSYSAFIETCEVTDSFIVREGSSVDPFKVDTSYVETSMPDKLLNELKQCIESLSASLSLHDGLVHTQFISDGKQLRLIEVTRRCPGDLYSLLIEYSTGFEYAAKYASCFIGESCDPCINQSLPILRHTVFTEQSPSTPVFEMNPLMRLKYFYPVQIAGPDVSTFQPGRAGVLFAESICSVDLNKAYEAFINDDAYQLC